jgi:hypothetical protein
VGFAFGWTGGLEVESEVGEGGQFEEVLTSGRLVDYLVLEHPCEVVWDEDGVEAGAEGWIDVRAGAVADHPSGTCVAAVVSGEGSVGLVMLFGENLYGCEVRGEAGAVEFVCLLFLVALGDHDETVTGGEIGKGGVDAGKEFDLLVGDGLGEVFDAAMLFFGEGGVGELLETGDEGAAEAVKAVAVGANGGVLDVVQVSAHLFGGVDTVVEIGDEAGDGALEVDVVFPESVVGVDEQSLGDRRTEGLRTAGLGSGDHELII